MTTQPILPAPVDPSPIERAYIDDTPADLWPSNQDSNFGIHRKVFCDTLMDVVNQLHLIYNEAFAATSEQYLAHWEEQVGLPINPSGLTIAQRQARVISRSRRGAFTNTLRRQIVEDYITATFGAAPVFGTLGIPLGSGVPLYSGQNSLVGTYAIRENWPEKNLVDNPNYETDLNTTGPVSATVAWSTAQAKFGTHSMLVTATATGSGWVTQIRRSDGQRFPVTPNTSYTLSVYVRPGSGSRQLALGMDFYQASGTLCATNAQPRAGFSAPVAGWSRISFTAVAPPDAASLAVYPVIFNSTGAIGDSVYADGVQLEIGSAATDWSDSTGQSFFYEVRLLNTLGVDLGSLNRELLRVTPSGIAFVITQTASP